MLIPVALRLVGDTYQVIFKSGNGLYGFDIQLQFIIFVFKGGLDTDSYSADYSFEDGSKGLSS